VAATDTTARKAPQLGGAVLNVPAGRTVLDARTIAWIVKTAKITASTTDAHRCHACSHR
jgi:hypothetical protein